MRRLAGAARRIGHGTWVAAGSDDPGDECPRAAAIVVERGAKGPGEVPLLESDLARVRDRDECDREGDQGRRDGGHAGRLGARRAVGAGGASARGAGWVMEGGGAQGGGWPSAGGPVCGGCPPRRGAV